MHRHDVETENAFLRLELRVEKPLNLIGIPAAQSEINRYHRNLNEELRVRREQTRDSHERRLDALGDELVNAGVVTAGELEGVKKSFDDYKAVAENAFRNILVSSASFNDFNEPEMIKKAFPTEVLKKVPPYVPPNTGSTTGSEINHYARYFIKIQYKDAADKVKQWMKEQYEKADTDLEREKIKEAGPLLFQRAMDSIRAEFSFEVCERLASNSPYYNAFRDGLSAMEKQLDAADVEIKKAFDDAVTLFDVDHAVADNALEEAINGVDTALNLDFDRVQEGIQEEKNRVWGPFIQNIDNQKNRFEAIRQLPEDARGIELAALYEKAARDAFKASKHASEAHWSAVQKKIDEEVYSLSKGNEPKVIDHYFRTKLDPGNRKNNDTEIGQGVDPEENKLWKIQEGKSYTTEAGGQFKMENGGYQYSLTFKEMPRTKMLPTLLFGGIFPALGRKGYELIQKKGIAWENKKKAYKVASSDVDMMLDLAKTSGGGLSIGFNPDSKLAKELADEIYRRAREEGIRMLPRHSAGEDFNSGAKKSKTQLALRREMKRKQPEDGDKPAKMTRSAYDEAKVKGHKLRSDDTAAKVNIRSGPGGP